MLESGTVLQYPGLPMAKYGAVPPEYGGGNKYRIIWAPSRVVVLTGRERTMTVPMYTGKLAIEPVGDFWILEGWKSPWEIAGTMTAKEWNANPAMLNTGPFPARGDYVRHETLSCNPCEANIEKLITWIEAGGQRRQIDNAQAVQKNLEADIADRKSKRDAILRDARRAFGSEAMIGAGTRQRATKTHPILKSREELGLPAAGVTSAIKPRRPVVYEVPQEA